MKASYKIHFPLFVLCLAFRSILYSAHISAPSIDHQAITQKQLVTRSIEELDADWNLESFFGSIYVINLPQATQRLEQITEQLRDVGVKNFEILSATNGRKDLPERLWKKMRQKSVQKDMSADERKKFDLQRQGETGCYISHLRLLELVRDNYKQALITLKAAEATGNPKAIQAASALVKKYSSVLIFEDDTGFGVAGLDRKSITKRSVGTIFRKAMAELPSDWDMIYFMSLPYIPSKKATTHLAHLQGAVIMNAYAIHYPMYDKLYNQLKKLYDPKVLSIHPVDVEYGNLHKNTKCYGIIPSITYQAEGLSSITSVTANHVRQKQSYQDDQASEFMNSYSSLVLHPFSTNVDQDERFQFLNEACVLATLKDHFAELSENNFEKQKIERRKITARLQEFCERKIVERGRKHTFKSGGKEKVVAAVMQALHEEIISQLSIGTPLDQVAVNVPKAIFTFIKKYNNCIDLDLLIIHAYLIMIDNYELQKIINQK
ncbi:MAG: lipooligosaccharide galactosyltransferase [Chlamydiia bacterium]|nr:lipooligosaccharide galactosyltransferase [Chlamydiia bacterium]